jgi:pSer/pThr/pTyr-binding forkhead associated (FHA) protein
MGWELQLPTGNVLKVSGTATIGRAPNNHIVLNDTLVSRVHVELHCQGAALIVNDLHSRNGTFVNEVPVSPALPRSVQPGDVLRVGNTNIRVRYTGDDTVAMDVQTNQTGQLGYPGALSQLSAYPGEATRRPLLPKPAQVLYASEPRSPVADFIEILKRGRSKDGT